MGCLIYKQFIFHLQECLPKYECINLLFLYFFYFIFLNMHIYCIYCKIKHGVKFPRFFK